MLHRNNNVHATSRSSCDEVIDEVITQILALKFAILTHTIGKIGANLSQKTKIKQIDSCVMITSD